MLFPKIMPLRKILGWMVLGTYPEVTQDYRTYLGAYFWPGKGLLYCITVDNCCMASFSSGTSMSPAIQVMPMNPCHYTWNRCLRKLSLHLPRAGHQLVVVGVVLPLVNRMMRNDLPCRGLQRFHLDLNHLKDTWRGSDGWSPALRRSYLALDGKGWISGIHLGKSVESVEVCCMTFDLSG